MSSHAVFEMGWKRKRGGAVTEGKEKKQAPRDENGWIDRRITVEEMSNERFFDYYKAAHTTVSPAHPA